MLCVFHDFNVFATVNSTRPIFSKSVNYCLNCHLPVGDVCATNVHCVESVGHKRATLQRLKTDLVKAIGGKLLKMKSLPPKVCYSAMSPYSSTAACAAATRAMGTRNGLQDT